MATLTDPAKNVIAKIRYIAGNDSKNEAFNLLISADKDKLTAADPNAIIEALIIRYAEVLLLRI